jgi:hypothetical protein
MTTEPTVQIPLELFERAIESCKGLLLQVLQETDGLSKWAEQAKQLIADLEAVKGAEPRYSRASYLTVSQQYDLNVACKPLAVLFGYGVFHVGSSLERPDYRDVDLRCILADDEYDKMFSGDNGDKQAKFLNVAISEWIQGRTKLPIDFQFQRCTQANEEFTGRRNAIGITTP